MSWKKLLLPDKLPFLFIIVLFVIWAGIVISHSINLKEFHQSDQQRDIAITYNILNGNFFGDHSYSGERAFFPQLEPSYYAFLTLVTGKTPEVLMYNYPVILAGMVLFLFIFGVYKMFKSREITLLAFLAYIFLIPYASWHVHVHTHPITMAFGMMITAIYFFYKAVETKQLKYYLLSGLGIALTILSEPYIALSLAGGITIYQILTRKNWKYFFLMSGFSFILVSFYLVPLLTTYGLKTKNTGLVTFIQGEVNPDFVFFGYGFFKYLNSFFILLGIIISFIRHKKRDLIILSIFSFSLFFVVWGILGTPPSLFVWQDIQKANHYIATILWAMGAYYVLRLIVGMLNKFSLVYRHSGLPARRNHSVVGSRIEKDVDSGVVPTLSRLPRMTFKSYPMHNQNSITTFLMLIFVFILSVFSIPKFLENADFFLKKEREYDIANMKDWEKTAWWIKKNTGINEVFLADPSPSYVYIGGMTGRKVVVTYPSHANPFVDHNKRAFDNGVMLSTADLVKFKKLSKKYLVKYIIISPWEKAWIGNGLIKFENPEIFKKVFQAGEVTIYRRK